MVGVAAVLTAFFLYVAGVISEPPKVILFSGLDPRAAAQVTAKLDAMQVKYDAKGDGGTILVPADEVTKLRMELASENLPAAGTGYEIFDKTDSFGTSAFVQNINELRALEGELARSIQTIDGIDSVRVHLVIPERQIFSREDQSPSASVVVKTEGRMNHGEVVAIQHLVAAAVAGLQPERVALVDDQGTLLAGGDGDTGPDAGAADEEQHTADLEDKLRQRVEGIVASVVGEGHVRVQIAADMNYDHTSTTSETFDPDSKVVRSTSTTEQNSSDTNAAGNGAVSVANALPNAQQSGSGTDNTKSSSGSTQETTNYEISKTTKTSVVDAGTVKRLSVAVVVDGDNKADASGKATYTPRTPQQMSQIEALVKSAIGYDKTRGDDVKVVNMQFAHLDVADATPAPAPLLGLDSAYWFKIIEAAILSLTALLIGLFVVRPLIGRMFAPQAAGESTALLAAQQMAGQLPAPGQAQAQAAGGATMALPPPKESMIDISRIEGQVRESSIKKVGEVVGSHPEEALAIIRTWLHEPV
jgi:flagellar M-ring protein FliF